MYKWGYCLYINEKNGKERTVMMLKRNTAQPTTFDSKKERVCVCYNERMIAKETNFHHFYSISFLILSSREMPSFNFLTILKELAKATAILTQFLLLLLSSQNTGWRHFVYTYHQSYLAVRAPFSKYYQHQPSLRCSRHSPPSIF